MIICIGREFGSGGHEIGTKLAEELNIPCYDRELIEKTAKQGYAGEAQLEKADERKHNPWLHTVYYEADEPELRGLSANDILFKLQRKAILELAEQGSCIFIGRCADFILREQNIPCVSLFITAPFSDRVSRKMKLLGQDEKTVTALVRKTDKQRKAYYNYYTGQNWSKAYNYDFCINSSALGTEGSVRAIACFIRSQNERGEAGRNDPESKL